MKTLLYLTPSGTQFWRKSREGWQACDGPPDGPVWVVTDLAEESFSEIQIPRLFGPDRQAFIARQLVNRFPDTPFRTTLPTLANGALMDRLAPPRQTLLGVDAAQRVNAALDRLSKPIAGVWAMSMLLALIGAKKGLPTELFVVLPTADALRIVFIKNRVPVLSRLVPGASQAQELAAEIFRTLRHLENTRVLERSERRHGVLMLGEPLGMAALLAHERLDLLVPPSPWASTAPADWRFALFDLAMTSPAGQLAPMSRRTSFVAANLRQPAYAVAAFSLGLGLWASVGNLREIVSNHSSQSQTEGRTRALTAQLNEVEQKMAGFGVPPELVRQAAALDRDELASAPSMATQMQQLGQVIGQHPGVRLVQLEWRIVLPGQAICTGAVPSPASNPDATVTDAATPKRQVEISFEIDLPKDQTTRARAQSVASLSSVLAKLHGATLIRDPAKALAQATLSGGAGARPEAEQALSWCLSLPGQPDDAATPAPATRP